MISFITGTLFEKSPTNVIIEKNGIGIEILIPLSTFESLGAPGQVTTLITYLYVKEDALILFGFTTKEERELFLHLLSVSGIGPKLALGILSGIKIADFYGYIARGDEDSLVRIKGLGKKTAQRIILDLKDIASKKIKLETISVETPVTAEKHMVDEALLALLSLGYSRAEAEKAINKAVLQINDVNSVEELVRIALNN
ncbi:Holliday junction branch migration protein RuvA [candidate division KSB1 bacterium]|nr:Holliday junction branch migration protein RuvA [candidate division KSB1 bacterium]